MGQPLTKQEYSKIGSYNPETIARRLGDGSWIDALEQFGDELSERDQYVTDDALRGDVASVAAELERPPTVAEYGEYGTFAPITIARRFGDGLWTTALERFGFDSTSRRDASSNDELRAAVDRVVTNLGKAPTRREFAARSRFEPQQVANRFGDGIWQAALEQLGYEANHHQSSNRISDADLRVDLERVIAELGEIPTSREYNSLGDYAAQTLGNRFGKGSWRDALVALGYSSSASQSRNMIPDERLSADVRHVAAELGSVPTAREYDKHGDHSPTTIANRLGDGSWTKALETLGLDVD